MITPMDATPISFETAAPFGGGRTGDERGQVDATGLQWAALHDAADAVAQLAGISPAPHAGAAAFASALREAPHWRRKLVDQGVQDLSAMMEPGLVALISVHGVGRDAAVPAMALWHEFVAARDALVATVLPAD